MRSSKCPKCQGAMSEGFLPVQNHGMSALLTWSQGTPRKGWWGVKSGGKPIDISAWRCQRCGFLEFYARD